MKDALMKTEGNERVARGQCPSPRELNVGPRVDATDVIGATGDGNGQRANESRLGLLTV